MKVKNIIPVIFIWMFFTQTNLNAQVEHQWTIYNDGTVNIVGLGNLIVPTDENFTYWNLRGFEDNGEQVIVLLKVNSEGIIEWEQVFSGPVYGDDLIVQAMVDTTDYSVWLAGYGQFVAGSYDAQLLLKYDSLGNLLAQHYHDNLISGGEYFRAIAQDEKGTIYCTGDVLVDSTTVYAYKASGDLKWTSKNNWGPSLNNDNIVCKNGFLYTSGSRLNQPEGEKRDLHVAKYDTLGNELWFNLYSEYPEEPYPVLRGFNVNDKGEVSFIINGLASPIRRLVRLDSDGALLNDILLDDPNGVLYHNTNDAIYVSRFDSVVTKLDSIGQTIWETSIPLSKHEPITFALLGPRRMVANNDYLVCSGTLTGLNSGYLYVIDANDGTVLWDTLTTNMEVFSTELFGNTLYVTGRTFNELEDSVTYLSKYEIVTMDTLTSIETFPNQTLVSVYPNPAKEQVRFQFAPSTKPKTLRFYNAFGKVVKEVEILTGIQEQKVSLTAFSSGLYFWELGNTRGKLMVK